MVLYELVVGRRPFVRQDPLDVVRDHLNTLPPPPRAVGAQISAELEAAILKALAKDPKGRWQSAEELSAALAKVPEMSQQSTVDSRQLTEQKPAVAPAASAPARATGARANYVPWAIAGALALLLVVVVIAARKRPATTVAPPPPAAPKVVAAPPPSSAPSAQRHLQQAIDYQRKLWCSDALEEVDKALRDDAGLRDDASLQRVAISCLTPKTRERAVRLLVERVGASGRSELTRAATESANGEVRKGAREALDRLPR